MLTGDPKVLALAFIGGLVPSLLWLWFWLKEDKKNPEPASLLTLVFIMGMLSVIVVLPIQKWIEGNIADAELRLTLWATAEEIIKFVAAAIILHKTYQTDEPIDWPIYLITVALGFAALENALFLIKPLSLGQTAVGLLTGQLRFLGSTLLHTVASGTIGITLGLSIYMKWASKKWYLLAGLILSIALHSTFNFFIIRNNGLDFLKVFGLLWVAAIVIMLLFEKLRRMNQNQ